MRSVSIDIDGVIAEPLMPNMRNGLLYRINRKYQLKKKYTVMEVFLHRLISSPKKPKPEALLAIKKLQEQSYTIILNSSRPAFLEEITYKWLKRHGIAGYVHGLRLRHVDKEPSDAKLSTMKRDQIDIHFDDDPVVVESLLEDDSVQQIFFINTNEKAKERFSGSPKVVCASDLNEAVQYLLRSQHG